MGNYLIGKNEILFKFCLLMRISGILIRFKLKIITFITSIDEEMEYAVYCLSFLLFCNYSNYTVVDNLIGLKNWEVNKLIKFIIIYIFKDD